MKQQHFLLRVCLATFIIWNVMGCRGTQTEPANEAEVLLVDQIWSGCAANYALLTEPPYQFVAYYDSARYMTIAQRHLSEKSWNKTRLPSRVGWDAHNYITMILDQKGCLHVSGNMHVDSLVYFQSEKPFDAGSLKQQTSLIRTEEHAVTYPEFFEASNGDLIFTYRTGSSGKGNQVYNRYHAETNEWSRLLDVPLIDGEGKSNAYIHGPVIGPDGYFHMIWVWRMNPDANANCNISYAKSNDLMLWIRSDGTPLVLPMTMENCEVIDPVPVGNGLLNGNTKIGFDTKNRVVVSYHKYDEDGNIQIYNARREENGWEIYQATDWNWRWDFGGWGSIISRVGLSKVGLEGDRLTQTYYVDSVGYQKFLIDEENLQAGQELEIESNYPDSMQNLSGNLDMAQVHLLENSSEEHGIFVLRWETLKRNRDKPYDFVPESQPLELYHFEYSK